MDKSNLTGKAQEWPEQAEDAAREFEEKARRWQERAREGARRAAETTNEYVHENPWTIIGSIALAALLLGVLLGRSRN